MTTVLTPSERTFPSLKWPNKVQGARPAEAPPHPYIVGRPRFNPWTSPDQYAGPEPVPGAAGPAWGYRTSRPPEDWYAAKPNDFWPCVRSSYEQVLNNRSLKVNPTFAGLDQMPTIGFREVAVVAGAGALAYFLTRAAFRGELTQGR